MITMLETGRARARMPRTLILEPTRELAAQVQENFEKYGVGQKLNVALLIGGVSLRRPGRQAHPRRRRADRDAGPPARSFRARPPAAHRRRIAGDRRSRPHAGYGLHPRHRAHLQARSVHPPDAVLHGDHASGNPAHHRAIPAQSGEGRSRREPATAATTITQQSSKAAASRTRSAKRCADILRSRRELQERHHLLQSQARSRAAASLAGQARLQRGRPAWRHGPVGAHGRAREVPQGRSCRC